MASIFNTGSVPSFSKEQQKIRRAAWKPSTVRLAMQQSAPAVTVFRSEKAEAEYQARLQMEAAEKAAKVEARKAAQVAGRAKAAATRAAKAKKDRK